MKDQLFIWPYFYEEFVNQTCHIGHVLTMKHHFNVFFQTRLFEHLQHSKFHLQSVFGLIIFDPLIDRFHMKISDKLNRFWITFIRPSQI